MVEMTPEELEVYHRQIGIASGMTVEERVENLLDYLGYRFKGGETFTVPYGSALLQVMLEQLVKAAIKGAENERRLQDV